MLGSVELIFRVTLKAFILSSLEFLKKRGRAISPLLLATFTPSAASPPAARPDCPARLPSQTERGCVDLGRRS
jgi:hypothetical protein